MTGLTIAAGQFLVFTAHGAMPTALIDTWTSIGTTFLEGAPTNVFIPPIRRFIRSKERVDVYMAVASEDARPAVMHPSSAQAGQPIP